MTSRWHRFRCFMGWHLPDAVKSFDGCSVHSRCRWCKREVMQDSHGNWFTFMDDKEASK